MTEKNCEIYGQFTALINSDEWRCVQNHCTDEKSQSAKPKFHCQTTNEKCQIWLIWHYKMPVSNLVLQLRMKIYVVIWGPVCVICFTVFISEICGFFGIKAQEMWKVVAYHGKHQNSRLRKFCEFVIFIYTHRYGDIVRVQKV